MFFSLAENTPKGDSFLNLWSMCVSVFCCAGVLARLDRAQPSAMPVPPPPAPPPPPTLALVSFAGSKGTVYTVLCCCLSYWKGHTEASRGGRKHVWYLGKTLLCYVYGWWLILQEGPSLALLVPIMDITSHIHSPSSSSSHRRWFDLRGEVQLPNSLS